MAKTKEITEETVETGIPVVAVEPRKGFVISKLEYSVEIKISGTPVTVPPYGRVVDVTEGTVVGLKKGIYFKAL